jgi:hypothetical protein
MNDILYKGRLAPVPNPQVIDMQIASVTADDTLAYNRSAMMR